MDIFNALTRCPTCLSLSVQHGQCNAPDHSTIPNWLLEEKALFMLTIRGYRLVGGWIWITKHEEPDTGWEGLRIAEFDGSNLEAYRLLESHRWPETPTLQCVSCHEVDVAELGQLCRSCGSEAIAWARAGEAT
jgi:hypothetical protein